MRAAAVLSVLLLLLLSLLRGGPPLHPALLAAPGRSLLCLAAGLYLAFGPGAGPLRRGLESLLFRTRRVSFNLALFAGSAAAAAAVGHLAFEALPYLDDGVASLFQARIFARGSLTLPLPRNAEFFELFGVLGAREGLGVWAGMYPPGWPALLAPGSLLGAPWVVNTLLGGALPVATAELGRIFYGERAGRVAGLLALASPMLLVLAGTHLSHTATALFLVLCLWWLTKLLDGGSWTHGLLAGSSWGAAFLCRPLDALLVGMVFAVPLLVRWRESFAAWRGILAALLATLLAASTLAAFQKHVTGDAMTPGHTIGMGKLGSFGFITLAEGHEHNPARAVDSTLKRLRSLNDRMSGWPLPFFLLLVVPFWSSSSRWRDLLLLAPTLLLAAVFAFYWYYEGYFPGRYLSASAPLLLLLAARGLCLLEEGAAGIGRLAPRVLLGAVAASFLFMLAVALPGEIHFLRRNAGDVERTLPRVVEAYGIENAVVFMDAVSTGVAELERMNDFYATGFMRNSLDLDDAVLFARNSREQNHLLIAQHPGRSYYLYRYHRDTRRALLYRLLPRGGDFCLLPVEPTEGELLLPAEPLTGRPEECRREGGA